MTTAFLATAPWILLGLYLALRVRLPRPLPEMPEEAPPSASAPDSEGRLPTDSVGADRRPAAALPFVSIIIPARNEAKNIVDCLGSIVASEYPGFEVVVVDDRSDDGTADLARGVGHGNAHDVRVIEGERLPAGWFGKPWACEQGAQVAKGEVLLFTDADTRHHPHLLTRAILGLVEDRVEALSLFGRQQMETFWERVVQPQIFLLLGVRFPDSRKPFSQERWNDAIANGQFILVQREAYDRIGGHQAVRNEVVEDLRLAQEICRSGGRLTLREAQDVFATRMYTSLGEIVAGWSKNLAWGGRQALPAHLAPFGPPAIVLFIGTFWLLPPIALAWALSTGPATQLPLLVWGGMTTAFGLFIWMGAAAQFRLPAIYGAFFPLGAAVAAYIFLRSWIRGSRIEWKGRQYTGGEGEVGS